MSEELLVKLTKDLRTAAKTMTTTEARYLVDSYYQMQENRLRASGQIRSMEGPQEPHAVLSWLEGNASTMEKQIQRALGYWVEAHPVGQWCNSVKGIGPVLSAGLLAHIDLEPWKCAHTKGPKDKACSPQEPHGPECKRIEIHSAGHLWSFSGANPNDKWEKGQKRPWNASMKRLRFLISVSFEKLHNDPTSPYGELYNKRKAYEQAKNAAGDYADQAAQILKERPTHAQAKIYKTGKLPDGHIRMRVLRYVSKQFLSDFFTVLHRHHFKCDPPKPYPIAILGHAHERKVA